MGRLPSGLAVLACLAVVLSCWSGQAEADVADRLILRGETALGFVVLDQHPEPLDFGFVAQGGARLSLLAVSTVSIEASLVGSYFPSEHGASRLLAGLGGLRVHSTVGRVRLSANADVGVGETAGVVRPTADVGVLLELPVWSSLALGPFVRYSILFAAEGDEPGDVQFVTIGLSFRLEPKARAMRPQRATVRSTRRAANAESRGTQAVPPNDRDRDSVLDDDDACPEEAGTPSGQPSRHGCPGLISVVGDRFQTGQPVVFHDDVSQSEPTLEALVSALEASPTVLRLSLECHSTSRAERAARDLCERWANSAMLWLIRHGVEPSRVEVRLLGSDALAPEGDERTWLELRIVRGAVVDGH